jgi:hypothetical protein
VTGGTTDRRSVIAFLRTLALFPADDTASNLDPGGPSVARYPQFAHVRINLGALFNNPTDPE